MFHDKRIQCNWKTNSTEISGKLPHRMCPNVDFEGKKSISIVHLQFYTLQFQICGKCMCVVYMFKTFEVSLQHENIFEPFALLQNICEKRLRSCSSKCSFIICTIPPHWRHFNQHKKQSTNRLFLFPSLLLTSYNINMQRIPKHKKQICREIVEHIFRYVKFQIFFPSTSSNHRNRERVNEWI